MIDVFRNSAGVFRLRISAGGAGGGVSSEFERDATAEEIASYWSDPAAEVEMIQAQSAVEQNDLLTLLSEFL